MFWEKTSIVCSVMIFVSPAKKGDLNLCRHVYLYIYMLQARRLRVRFPMRSQNFSNLPNLSINILVLGFTQCLTGMSTRNLAERGKVRPADKADSLTSICELSGKCGILNVSSLLYGLPRAVTEKTLIS
jgi:hypothetical protein